VRRAVIFGLRRVRQPWATQILEEMQIEDAQWVVKDAAAQAVENLKSPDPSVPTPLLPLEDTPWLIAYASDRGMGINQNMAREMLLRVLREGNEDEILAALGQVQRRGETDVFPIIYHLIFGDKPEVRDAAYTLLWHLGGLKAEIPPSIQFGLG